MADSTTADQFHARLDQAKLRLVRWLGHSLATREGEETPKLDQVNPGDTEATREGEETPKLDQVDRGSSTAPGTGNRWGLTWRPLRTERTATPGT